MVLETEHANDMIFFKKMEYTYIQAFKYISIFLLKDLVTQY